MNNVELETSACSQKEWTDLVDQFADVSLLQLWEYGQAKAATAGWDLTHHVFRHRGVVVGAAQALIKTLPVLGRGVVWINRAPLWRRSGASGDPKALFAMLEALKRYWVLERGFYLRVAPSLGPALEHLGALRTLGFAPRPNSAWISAVVDLRQSPEKLRVGLHKKWRNCLKKSEGLGIAVHVGSEPALFQQFLDDYERFLKTKEFATNVTPEFLIDLQRALPQERKMLVLGARKAGQWLGSVLMAQYGSTAEYLAGAVNPVGKAANVGQLLLWNGMVELKRRGMERLDVGGAHPTQTPEGIYHFKQGLGGSPYELIGQFECVAGVRGRAIQLATRLKGI